VFDHLASTLTAQLNQHGTSRQSVRFAGLPESGQERTVMKLSSDDQPIVRR
jgi:hypothetical protein